MINLTTLAPVDANLDEMLPLEVTLFDLAAGTPCCGRNSGKA
jgi:hypothetical protein